LATNRYLYNEKEVQPRTGLIDYGARQYAALEARWNGVDKLAMLDFSDSPFIYVSDNPIRRIDLLGMTDVNHDGIDDGISLQEVVIKGKKPKSDPIFGNLWIQYARNEYYYGHPSPYREHFQAGGRDAALLIGAPIAAIGAAEAGAGALFSQGMSYLTRARMISMGRGITRGITRTASSSWNFLRTQQYLTVGTKLNVGAGLGDLTAQLATNGGDINQVNWLGVGGEMAIGGNLLLSSSVVAAMGSFTTLSFNEQKIAGGTREWIGFGFGTLGNLGDGLAAEAMQKYYGSVMSSFDTNVFDFGTNSVFGVGGTKATEMTTQQLQKR
jgi:RHS repeat-associated protein